MTPENSAATCLDADTRTSLIAGTLRVALGELRNYKVALTARVSAGLVDIEPRQRSREFRRLARAAATKREKLSGMTVTCGTATTGA